MLGLRMGLEGDFAEQRLGLAEGFGLGIAEALELRRGLGSLLPCKIHPSDVFFQLHFKRINLGEIAEMDNWDHILSERSPSATEIFSKGSPKVVESTEAALSCNQSNRSSISLADNEGTE